MFSIEDYEDTHEFRIFNEDYLKFRHFLVPNSFVYCKIKVQQGWIDKNTGKPRDPRVQFLSMQQLQDVMAQAAKKLTIQFHVSEILEERVQLLQEVLEKHSGDHQLFFEIRDHEEKIALNMPSRMKKVNVKKKHIMALEITDANFEEVVLNSDKPVMVDFWAAWCGPCRMVGPIIDEVSTDYDGKAVVGKMDVDTNQEFAAKYGVRNIPTVLVFQNGEVVGRQVGVAPKDAYTEALDALLS